jgi:hypothetical protein
MAKTKIKGVIEARKCKCCGHHELGIKWTFRDKEGHQWPGYKQLKPGDEIILIVDEE